MADYHRPPPPYRAASDTRFQGSNPHYAQNTYSTASDFNNYPNNNTNGYTSNGYEIVKYNGNGTRYSQNTYTTTTPYSQPIGSGSNNTNPYYNDNNGYTNGYEIVKYSGNPNGGFDAGGIFTTASLPPPEPVLALPPPPGRRVTGGGGPVAALLCFSDPEMKRKKRVASYKAYSVEGKVKSSLKRGLRWIKGKCSEIFHGW